MPYRLDFPCIGSSDNGGVVVMDEQPNPMRQDIKTIDKQRMDQFSRFLHTTTVKGEEERFNALGLLIGKEMATGNITRDDMPCNEYEMFIIQELDYYGQRDMYFTFLIGFVGMMKLTMSIDHVMLDGLTTSKIEYAQTSTIHEHQHQDEGPRRGILGGKR